MLQCLGFSTSSVVLVAAASVHVGEGSPVSIMWKFGDSHVNPWLNFVAVWWQDSFERIPEREDSWPNANESEKNDVQPVLILCRDIQSRNQYRTHCALGDG